MKIFKAECLLSLVSIYSKLHDHHTKNKAIMCLSSHPSHQSICFDSKLIVVVLEIGFMETRFYTHSYQTHMPVDQQHKNFAESVSLGSHFKENLQQTHFQMFCRHLALFLSNKVL